MYNKQGCEQTSVSFIVYVSIGVCAASDLVTAFQKEENQVAPNQIVSKMDCMSLCLGTTVLIMVPISCHNPSTAKETHNCLWTPDFTGAVCKSYHTTHRRNESQPLQVRSEGISPGLRANQNPSCLLVAHRSTILWQALWTSLLLASGG